MTGVGALVMDTRGISATYSVEPMWISDIDIPGPLLEAHQAGDLVLFVGAGASRGEPSNLPDFPTLALDIATDANVPVSSDQLGRVDELLGLLQDQHHVDVHARVAARIRDPESKPNKLHEAIIALARAGQSARIVTTNYDLHLSTVLAQENVTLPTYTAPALPIGDDFDGIVYLHGNLHQAPRHLIVTDVDFGRAYLRDAWAARFLERMFTTSTVLFVGYSHTDVVMRYLARGLGKSSRRYILTDKPDASDWRALGTTPVGYPNADSRHGALVEGIARWAERSSMGLLDHRQRLARMTAGDPPQTPEDASYAELALSDDARVRFFAEHARGPEWLRWAANHPEFQKLFEPTAVPTTRARVLADWFAEHFVLNEALTSDALSVVQQAGGHLGPAALDSIGLALHRRKWQRPAWVGPWIILLIQNAPGEASDWLGYALVASTWPDDSSVAMRLLDHLANPLVAMEPSYGATNPVRMAIRLRGDEHWLTKAWEDLLSPNLAEIAYETIAIAHRHLRTAHSLLTIAGSANDGWDPSSFTRHAIETHEKDNLSYPIDFLVNVARDSLTTLISAGDPLGYRYVEEWERSGAPLLQRLSIHGWIERDDVDASAKITWLRDKGWLFDHQLRHEVFRLIAKNLANADPEVGDALVADADAGPERLEVHRYFESFLPLSWMARHAPDLPSAADALRREKEVHPEYEDSQSTDEPSPLGFRPIPSRPPMSDQSLHDLIGNDASAAVTELRSYEEATPPYDSPTWLDSIELLEATVRRWPNDGFMILDTSEADHPDILPAVVRAWSRATLDDDTAKLVLAQLRNTGVDSAPEQIAKLLADGGKGGAESTKWHRFPDSRRLAVQVWNAIGTDEPTAASPNWLSVAVNSPAGWLTEFWLATISEDWRARGESWRGLPAYTRVQLGNILSGADDRTRIAEVFLSAQINFLLGADQSWAERNIVPLLNWSQHDRARRTWDGYLTWGRWNDRLLRVGLLDEYLATARNVSLFGDQSRRQLARHLASISTQSSIDPIASGWVSTFTTSVNAADRTEWLDQITWLLRDLPPDEVERQWARWMRDYWRHRIDSVPMQLTTEEASAMAQWTVYLRESMSEGAELATMHPARLTAHSSLLADLTEERVALAPTAIAAMVAHLLQGSEVPFWDCPELKRLVENLLDHLNRDDVKPVVEQALGLGCSDAPNW